MRTLLIDNYDSFTFNLFQLIYSLSGIEPIVIKNDQMSWAEAAALGFSNIVISPGPGRPDVPCDFGISREAILDGRWPVLGVCLGHQGICHYLGGAVHHAQKPMHGIIDAVIHNGTGLFENIPSPFHVVRYHSLAVEALPECLIPTAFSSDSVIMAVEHRDKPIWGVQFHPESICSEHGSKIITNFLALAANERRSPEIGCSADADDGNFRIFAKRLDHWTDPQHVIETFSTPEQPVFWLDSSLSDSTARFSFIGDASGPHSEVLSYEAASQKLTIAKTERMHSVSESILDYMDRRLEELKVDPCLETPFDFAPGYVGYFGYEMKAETGGTLAHKSRSPDAQFIFADRALCFDLQEQAIWLVCMDLETREDRARAWFEAIEKLVVQSPQKPTSAVKVHIESLTLRANSGEYLELIDECLSKIRDGESYEVCLTNTMEARSDLDDLATYMLLRGINPAPYSAFLRFPNTSVLCSSPELFIERNRHGIIRSKPIKGTIRRGKDPEEDAELKGRLSSSEKERAENLMIVDLIRNDLGRVCEVGTVVVPKIFDVETYATVHQLVSTIEGRLRSDRTLVDLVRATFPGGSMTGAPKVRTMEILDKLEDGARGVYSGALGFLSVTGTAALNIVIRTIVLQEKMLSIGVGGAITALSVPSEELSETQLKAEALLRTLSTVAGYPIKFKDS
ncbi:aminodeoxychorismate synthase component I [Rhizobium sp. ZPR3]|uniref:aminodeoxychorismate synthase n=2 Tax=unclassified Rhizobium TaxID=2613769 RepID=A0AAU7S9M5_9HYPH